MNSTRPLRVALAGVLMLLVAAAYADMQLLSPIPNKPMAPDFTLKDLDGKSHRLSDYRGQVVILNFWATWCPPCRREMPSMERAWHRLQKNGAVILAVDVGEDLDTVYTFLADIPVSFPLLLDEDAEIVSRFPIRGLPTTYVVDPSGHLVYQAVGGREWDNPDVLKTILDLREAPQQVQAATPTPTSM